MCNRVRSASLVSAVETVETEGVGGDFPGEKVNPQKRVGEKNPTWILVTIFNCKRKQSVFYSLPPKTQRWEKNIQMARKTVTGDDF